MKLSRIKMENLFGQFNYDIKLNQEEGITILTGPNGYGKTTILKIIWGLFNQDFDYIRSVPFKEIGLNLDNGQAICITKEFEQGIRVTQNGGTRITHDNAKRGINITKLCFKLTDKNAACEFFEFSGAKAGKEQTLVLKLLESIKVYFIRDQRLAYAAQAEYDGTFSHDGTIKHDGVAVLNTIDQLSRNLVELISQVKSEENKLALNLADSFPDRLLKYGQPLPYDVFEKRFEALFQKQQRLQAYSITPGVFTRSEYEGENQRVLSVYLEDYERKTALYDELLKKLDLFLSILNGKELVNKTITVNAKDGFSFVTSKGGLLLLDALSSGEQNEIILLYELLFNAPSHSLVLIDEPETSMHVTWQLDFLHDIESIAKISGLSFIIATHSPDLINDKIDLCVDLFENARRNGDDGE
jgi:ABC-type transport system involved in cytochrome c biogenesis ATPase subunit